MLKRFVLLIPAWLCIFSLALADEGMWLPWNIGKAQLKKMQEMGLDLSQEKIFSTKTSSLKDAVVSLDSGSCTGSFISNNGLLLTNHHCAYSDIQKHSTLSNDYLQNGFWAQSPGQELPNPGKTASILLRVEDVTPLFEDILKKDLNITQRESRIDSIITLITDTASHDGRYTAEVKDFYFKDQFFLFISQTFRDVRLVAAPPSQLGQFGNNRDNWIWPRHSADFALFRVYTSKDGTPSAYSPENVPYTPKKFLEISIEGPKLNDFTMVMGYPGETQRFLTSFGINETSDIINPVVSEVRAIKQKIWKSCMHNTPLVDIQYSDKYASSSNYQKYASGQNKSIHSCNLSSQRETLEERFNAWVNIDSVTKENYQEVLSSAKLLYLLKQDLTKISITTIETMINGPDINSFVLDCFQLRNALEDLAPEDPELESVIRDFKQKSDEFFQNFNATLDHQVFDAMLSYYRTNLGDSSRVQDQLLLGKFKDFTSLTKSIYQHSIFTSSDRFNNFLEKPSLKIIDQDPAFSFMEEIIKHFAPIYNIVDRLDDQINLVMHKYVKGLKAMQPDKAFYPDANSTLRLTYGKIGPYSPCDGVFYKAFTSHKGLLEKYRSNIKNYQLPDSLLSLFQETNYGRYKDSDDTLPLCFISNNDITGGNSGSAVLNGKGQVIGLAFDGNWEGMSSDIEYVPDLQKCVCVDIRYILFLIENLGHNTHLIDELSLLN